MKISDLITMCIQNLTRRKVRTLLTVVGVVVGICAIVVTVSIGVGMSISQEEMLAQMGDLTMIEVYNYSSAPDTPKLNDEMVATIQAMDGVQIATPFYQPRYLEAMMVAGEEDRYEAQLWNIVGIYPDAMEAFGYQVNEGELMNSQSEPYTVMLGQYAEYNFRDTKRDGRDSYVNYWPDERGNVEDPFVDYEQHEILIKTYKESENSDDEDDRVVEREYKLNVAGTLVEDYNIGYETSQGVFMNINDLKQLEADYIKDNDIKITEEDEANYDYIKVKTTEIDNVEEVEEAIQALGYDTWSMEQIRKPMIEQTQQTQMVLGSLGAISLFVAAIGITNTMFMSIYERTREIGVMKVLGCFVSDIRTVFLMEAGLIGFIGGVIGIILSFGISFAMNYFGLDIDLGGSNMFGYMGGGSGQVSVIPMWLVGFALVFATLIGLGSGYLPANRAVKISALEAIKQDV